LATFPKQKFLKFRFGFSVNVKKGSKITDKILEKFDHCQIGRNFNKNF